MIRDEAAARRLAAAIVADFVLYNQVKLEASTRPRVTLAGEIQAARALFAGRVAPELHAVFEEALDARLGGALAGFHGANPGSTSARALPDYVERETSDDHRDTSGPGRLLAFSALVIAIGLAVLWWMLQRGG